MNSSLSKLDRYRISRKFIIKRSFKEIGLIKHILCLGEPISVSSTDYRYYDFPPCSAGLQRITSDATNTNFTNTNTNTNNVSTKIG